MTKAIEVKDFGGFTSSITTLWGKTPKIHMVCGECDNVFSKRFYTFECEGKFPEVRCPSCKTKNYVPIMKVE